MHEFRLISNNEPFNLGIKYLGQLKFDTIIDFKIFLNPNVTVHKNIMQIVLHILSLNKILGLLFLKLDLDTLKYCEL